MHRLFLQRYGVVVNGIMPLSDGFNSSSVTKGLEGRVTNKAQAHFEEQLNGQGLSTPKLAVLASILERLMHQEVTSELAIAYETLNFSMSDGLDIESATEVVGLFYASSSTDSRVDITLWRRLKAIMQTGPSAEVNQLQKSASSAIVGHPGFVDGRLSFDALATTMEPVVEQLGEVR
jgi:hypothetical protein